MLGVPALVIEPQGFIGGAPRGSTIAVGAGPAPGDSAAMFIGLTTNDGQTIVGIIPENCVEDLAKLVAEAAEQIRNRTFIVVEAQPRFQ